MQLTEHARRNRDQWDIWAGEYVSPGKRSWAGNDPTWGIWSVPESELRVLDNVAGKDVLEAGCGTAYWSAWLGRRGGKVVGLDNSPKQLETARELQQEHEMEFPLHLGTAEAMPFDDESFDIVFSEYGASIWCDPYLWIPDAVRVLRPGGQLAFLANSALVMLCSPDTPEPVGDRLVRPYFGMHRFEWSTSPHQPDDGSPQDNSVEFHLPHGEWIRMLRENGLEVEALIEVQAPEGAAPHRYTGLPTAEWARRWPSEEIWKARKVR